MFKILLKILEKISLILLGSIRAILFYLILLITVLIGVLLVFITWPLPFRMGRFLVIKIWSKLIVLAAKYICGLDFEIQGLKHLDNPPFIIFSKHQSAWETIAFSGIFPTNCFITKKELIYIPIFGWAFGISKHIPIDRKQGLKSLKDVSEQGKKRLAEGISIILFPEGTRVKPFENPMFHKGGAMLVKNTESPILCVAHNAGHFWKKNAFLKTPGKIKVIISPPMQTKGLSIQQINQMAYDWMVDAMKKIEK